jgi:hypothetical protein
VSWQRALALIGLLAGLLGLGINLVTIVPSLTSVSATNPVARALPEALVHFWTYFTHLANLGLLLAYLAGLGGWRGLGWFRRPRTTAELAVYATLAMVYYHFMLAPHYRFEGPLLLATLLLHYVASLCFLGWWIGALPHGQLRYVDMPWMLIPGLAYVAWVLARGAVVGDYPYAILDAGRFGYATVASGVAILAVAVCLLAGLAVFLDTLLARRRTTA